MHVKFEKKIGMSTFSFDLEVENIKDFFEKVAEYDDLPSVGPNGETDLKLVFRTTKENHKYYSIVCPTADKEFSFGVSKDNISLFPKGWQDTYKPEQNNAGNVQNNVGLGQQNYTPQQNYQAPPQQAPANNQAPPQQNYQAPPQNVNANTPPQQNYQAPPAQNVQAPPANNQVPQHNQMPNQQAPVNNAAIDDTMAKYGLS